jgi:hypothetical protein
MISSEVSDIVILVLKFIMLMIWHAERGKRVDGVYCTEDQSQIHRIRATRRID